MTAHPTVIAPKIVALIPAYNEDRFIGSVVLKAKNYVEVVVVVDDCSTDQTSLVASAAGAVVVRHDQNRGKAAALNTALNVARTLAADVVVLLDGDGQHHPEDIPEMIRPILEQNAELVVGSRFLAEHGSQNIPRWRVFGQQGLTTLTNTLSGFPLTDSQSGFRALSRESLQQLEFQQAGFSAESEMQFIARAHHWKVVEVPINVTGYEDGPKRNPVLHGMQVINGLLRLVGQSHPLLFFGGIGVGWLTLGLIIGVIVVNSYNAAKVLSVGWSLVMVLAFLIGVLSLFTGIILHSVRAFLQEDRERKRP